MLSILKLLTVVYFSCHLPLPVYLCSDIEFNLINLSDYFILLLIINYNLFYFNLSYFPFSHSPQSYHPPNVFGICP